MTDPVQDLLARGAVVDTITALFVATDERDWATVRACLAPRVHFDMTSLAGGEPAERAADDIIAGWEQGLRPIRAVHHQAGNFRVRFDGDEAAASCYAIAYHYLPTVTGRDTRVFVGGYRFRLRRQDGAWRITAFAFDLKFLDGNPRLEAEAKEQNPAPRAV